MNRGGALVCLLAIMMAVMLAGCGDAAFPARPDLPQSISPGWVRQSYEHTAPPPLVPARVPPDCMKAAYANQSGGGNGTAQVWVCGYRQGASAFDAAQRTPSAADTVRFQTGRYLTMVTWSGVSREEITALIRTVQKTVTGMEAGGSLQR